MIRKKIKENKKRDRRRKEFIGLLILAALIIAVALLVYFFSPKILPGPPFVYVNLVSPSLTYQPFNVTKDAVFNVSLNITCFTQDCGEVNVTLGEVDTRLVYQEDADEKGCGGFWLPGSPCTNAYDNDWSSAAISSEFGGVLENYTKPHGAIQSSLWQIKNSGGEIQNLSIPQDCWIAFSNKIVFQISCTGAGSECFYQCYNGTNQVTIADLAGGVFEDAMSWNISSTKSLPDYFTKPFYTLQKNWVSVNTNIAKVQTVVFSVNATGNLGTIGTFFATVYQDVAGGMTPLDSTPNWDAIIVQAADTTPPSVSIISPLNKTYNSAKVDFNISLSEAGDVCKYSFNGAANVSMSKFNSTDYYKTGISRPTLVEGANNMVVTCNDSAGNTNSNSVFFTRDTSAPSIQIISPNDGSTYSTNNLLLNISALDSNLDSVWWNNGAANISYTSPINYDFENDSIITITAYANDSFGNTNSTSLSFITGQASPSTITLTINSPADAYSTTSNSIIFNYNVTSTKNLASCSLILNGNAVDSSNLAGSSFANQQFAETLSTGSYTWNIRCVDTSSTSGTSSSRSLTITSPPNPGDNNGGSSGGGGGGGGVPLSLTCNQTCTTLNFSCGNHTVCGINRNCGVCLPGRVCTSTGKCIVQAPENNEGTNVTSQIIPKPKSNLIWWIIIFGLVIPGLFILFLFLLLARKRRKEKENKLVEDTNIFKVNIPKENN